MSLSDRPQRSTLAAGVRGAALRTAGTTSALNYKLPKIAFVKQ